MAPKLAAAVSAAMMVPAAGFAVGSGSPRGAQQPCPLQPRARAAGAAAPASGEGARGARALFGAAAAAGGVLAAAGRVGSRQKRRAAVAPRAAEQRATGLERRPNWNEEPYPRTGNWPGDKPLVPVPGSYKALGSMVGADIETGTEPWDPLGFSKLYDRNFDFNRVMTYPHVQWLRESELKHGRICMLAFVGMVVQQFVQIPSQPAEPDWTKALDACYADPRAALGIVQISVFAMLTEGRTFPENAWVGQLEREPGDLGFDPFKLAKGADQQKLQKLQLQELKNGRLAMIGVASLVANHMIPGSVPLLTGLYATQPEEVHGASGASAFCGSSASRRAPATGSKTAARYTTQVILPSLQWIKTGINVSSLKPKELKARNLAGSDVLVGKDASGRLFCVANLCPHIGTPMSEGADVIGDVIVCPLHGSSFKVTTGELIDWCPSPPIIGPLTGFVIEKKNLFVFETRTNFFGGEVEVLVDTNAKRAYEADYWKGILDAQGKDDGTYY